MTRAQVEAVARPLVAVAFVALLAGLSLQLAVAVHPIVGWLVPTVVVGALGWWLLNRWADDRSAAVAVEQHARRGEPLTLPTAPPTPVPDRRR